MPFCPLSIFLLRRSDHIRYPELCRQPHYRTLKIRREAQKRARIPEQVKPGARFNSKARMASQLAYFYQRDYIVLSYWAIDLRKQYGYPSAAFGGSLRLFSGPDDFYKGQESKEHNDSRVFLYFSVVL
jgi:hypothetical protein